MPDTLNSNNNTINVKTKVILNFYGGVVVAVLLAMGIVALFTFVHAQALIGTIIVFCVLIFSFFVFLAFKMVEKIIDLKIKHRQSLVVHYDPQRLVLLQKQRNSETRKLEYMPVVHHAPTEMVKRNYNYRVTDVTDDEDTTVIDASPPKQIEAPKLPISVSYEQIRSQIPKGHVLVGVAEQGVFTKEKEAKGLLWIVGGSGSGKSSSTVLRVHEDYERGHRFLGIDPHAFKKDSLTNSVKPYMDRFIEPIAYTPEDILRILKMFLAEFERRKKPGSQHWPLTLLYDEVGSQVSEKPEDETENQIILKTKEVARVGGQEIRGFEMGVTMISQDAAGLSFLRKRALLALVHKLQAWSERLLACNQNTDVAREMDNWPIGRTFAFGIELQGTRTVQQPLFLPAQHGLYVPESPRIVEAPRTYTMPPLAIREQTAELFSVSHTSPIRETPETVETLVETPRAATSAKVFTFPDRENMASSKKESEGVGNEIRETIKRMHKKMPLREIAPFVGLAGRKYPIFQQVCREENISEQAEEA